MQEYWQEAYREVNRQGDSNRSKYPAIDLDATDRTNRIDLHQEGVSEAKEVINESLPQTTRFLQASLAN